MDSTLPQDLVELGFVQDAQGLRGQIKVRPFSSDPVALLAAKSIWLTLLSPQRTSGAAPLLSTRLYAVNGAKLHSGFVVMSLDGVADRDQALAVKGARLSLSRDAFPKTNSNSYYWVDLIGCAIFNRENAPLGSITEMTENGAHAIMSVMDGDQTRLIPFVPEIVQSVDLTEKRVVVDWQADW